MEDDDDGDDVGGIISGIMSLGIPGLEVGDCCGDSRFRSLRSRLRSEAAGGVPGLSGSPAREESSQSGKPGPEPEVGKIGPEAGGDRRTADRGFEGSVLCASVF